MIKKIKWVLTDLILDPAVASTILLIKHLPEFTAKFKLNKKD